MTMKNKYAKSSHISERKFQQLVRLFAAGLEASQIARLTNLNRNTINRYLKKIRQRLVEYCDAQSPFSGEVEVDESFFGARRVKGKRGRGAYGKQSSSASFSGTVTFTPKSFQIALRPDYKRLYAAK
jgi:transposase